MQFDALCSIAYRAGCSYEDSQDVAQEALLLEWLHDGALPNVRRLAIDHWRLNYRYGRHGEHSISDALALLATEPRIELYPSSDELLERKQNIAMVQRELAKLSAEHQQVLRLYYFDDLNTSEIAIALNRPVATVKSRLWKAQELLKELILNALSSS